MKGLSLIFSLLIMMVSSLNASEALPPLKIGVDGFSPPYVMQGANNQFFGFDISMMISICKILKRDCQFEVLPFKELLDAVATKKVDAAVSTLIITPERAKKVNFSLPYLVSHSRFLGLSNLAKQSFNLANFDGQRIGIVDGTVFADEVMALGIKNPQIMKFDRETDLIAALQRKEIDIAVLENNSALYWQAQTSGALSVLGNRHVYGFGLGIAMNPDNQTLLENINTALLQYQNSSDFQRDYHKYIVQFNMD